MENINTLLTKLLKESGATVIIANPDTLSGLQKDGLKLDQPTSITSQERVNNLFEVKKKSALNLLNLNIIPALPNISIPTIGFLWEEIIECVLFGNNGAAITLPRVQVCNLNPFDS